MGGTSSLANLGSASQTDDQILVLTHSSPQRSHAHLGLLAPGLTGTSPSRRMPGQALLVRESLDSCLLRICHARLGPEKRQCA
eukprot:9848513-Alexandrium_andersonii.AAC.1